MRCSYTHPKFEDGRCPRDARPGWTTCASHYTAGRSTKPRPTGRRRKKK